MGVLLVSSKAHRLLLKQLFKSFEKYLRRLWSHSSIASLSPSLPVEFINFFFANIQASTKETLQVLHLLPRKWKFILQKKKSFKSKKKKSSKLNKIKFPLSISKKKKCWDFDFFSVMAWSTSAPQPNSNSNFKAFSQDLSSREFFV